MWMQLISLRVCAALVAATLAAGAARSETNKPPAAPPDHATARAALIKGLRESGKCQEPIRADKTFAPLWAKSAHFRSEKSTQAQLRNRAKPTEKEAELVAEWRRRYQPCRDLWIEHTAIIPNMAAVSRENYAKADVVLNALGRREISWGEFNTSLAKVIKEGEAARDRVYKEMDRTLKR
jgi:hypothetical protein